MAKKRITRIEADVRNNQVTIFRGIYGSSWTTYKVTDGRLDMLGRALSTKLNKNRYEMPLFCFSKDGWSVEW